MNRSEVIDLFIEIKQEYPYFDDSEDNIKRHLKYLKDFPVDAAMQNVEQHIMISRFAPGIADIRGQLGEHSELQRMRAETESYFAQVQLWQNNAAPPPLHLKERMKQIAQRHANRNEG